MSSDRDEVLEELDPKNLYAGMVGEDEQAGNYKITWTRIGSGNTGKYGEPKDPAYAQPIITEAYLRAFPFGSFTLYDYGRSLLLDGYEYVRDNTNKQYYLVESNIRPETVIQEEVWKELPPELREEYCNERNVTFDMNTRSYNIYRKDDSV